MPCNHRHVYLCCGCNHHQFGHTKERQTPLTGHWIGLIAHISITKDQTPNLTWVWTCWMTSFPSYSTTNMYLPGVIKHNISFLEPVKYVNKLRNWQYFRPYGLAIAMGSMRTVFASQNAQCWLKLRNITRLFCKQGIPQQTMYCQQHLWYNLTCNYKQGWSFLNESFEFMLSYMSQLVMGS